MSFGKIKLVGVASLGILAVVWILQNGGPVQTRFLFATVTMPQSALLAITLLMGIVAGILLTLVLSGKWKWKAKHTVTQDTP